MAKSRDQYFVVLHDSQWKIKLAGKYYGPYRTQADAIAEAVSTAKKNVAQGNDSQVLIQGENNRWRTEYTYGNDPWPPPG